MAWQDSSTAFTTWNGVKGPKVELQQGLRQGCVLSPILYCAFINCFLLEKPTRQVPEHQRGTADTFLSQGIQKVNTLGAGVWSTALRAKLMAFLFMDDTTLIAKTESGLKTLIEAYCNFCHKFRSKLNAKKSKLMRFSKDNQNEELSIHAGGHVFTTPKPNKNGQIRHKYLGFTCDTALSGKAHLEIAMGKANSMNQNLNTLAKAVTEEMTLSYLETNITPMVMYGMEMVDPKIAQPKLRNSYTNAVSHTTLTNKEGGWVGKKFNRIIRTE